MILEIMLIYVFYKKDRVESFAMEVWTHWQNGLASGERLCATQSHIGYLVSDIPTWIGWKPILTSKRRRTYTMATALLSYNDNGCTRAYKYLLEKKNITALSIILHHSIRLVTSPHGPVPALSLYLSLLLTFSKLVLICTFKCNVAKKHGLAAH